MARTVIDIDDDALVRAAAILGTTTKVDTVNQALRAIAGSASADEDARRFDEFLDFIGERLAECDVRAEAWRDGTGRPSHLAEPWE
ncbi:MAG: type II toxin-antitoxin system VapB family antitoxin [Sporichthyaceae bacterium]